MLEMWDPWQEFDRLRGEVDRVLGRYAGAGREEASVRPVTRIRETEDAYRLSIDLPGVPSDAIEVEARGRGLRLRADRIDAEDGLHLRYERLLTLPDGADPGGVEARHEDGVLLLRVPKRAEAMPRRVEIVSGARGAPADLEAGGATGRTAIGAPA